MSTFQGLEIAKSGMLTYRASMETAAHNLANVGTKGYSRQVVNTSSQIRNVSSIKVVGAGSYVQGIERIHNDYYDTKYIRANATYSKYSTHAYFLNEVQNKLYAKEEDDGGITTAFDAFCKCLTGTVTNAGDGTRRKEILTYADTFTEFVKETATNLQNLQEEANEKIKTTVDQINALAEKIASVTKQINTLEAYGNPANDLRDQRTLLVDQLSAYCEVKVVEQEPPDGVGVPQYYLYVNGGILLDTYDVNKLKVTECETKKNINDIDGLYKVEWTDGTPFNEHNTALGGELQALFDVRDGNNATVLSGTTSEVTNNAEGNLVITLTDASINDANLLNIPVEDGEITINNYTYAYDSFEVQISDKGEYTYQFTMKDSISARQSTVLENAVNNGSTATVSTSVNYKGIPYYMAQLNEFVRTYAENFNDVHKSGYDASGNQGIDFFNATVAATGENYTFTSRDENGNTSSFQSIAQKDSDGSYTGSYYYMTALNIGVTDAVMRDMNLLACSGASDNGESDYLNIQRLSELKDDSSMFLHGAPDLFLQSLTTDVGVDAKKAISLESGQKNVRDAVEIQRQSISGADEDEETESLVTFQNMLFNQYKVLSVMNEVLDKLINQTAV